MIIKETIKGTILADGTRVAIRIAAPDSESLIHVAYALVIQGPGRHILPSVLLDDWGNQVTKFRLYRWIAENGLHFPRAEVFGKTPSGAQAQYFLRDLELFAPYPLYVFEDKDAPDHSGLLVQAILIPDPSTESAQPIEPPADLSAFLRRSQVSWWRVDPQHDDLGFLA